MTDTADKQRLTYEELDVIVRAYQAGEDGAAQRLYEAFEGFIVCYLDMIHRGRYRLGDKKVRDFLSLYMKEDTRRFVHGYFMRPFIQQEMYKVAENLRQMFSQFTEHEITNELVCALYTLAKRYDPKDKKPRFPSYMKKAFHFQVRRQLAKLLVDPIAYRFDHKLLNEDEVAGESAVDDVMNMAMLLSGKKFVMIEDEFEDVIGDNWINGYTASETFQTLSKLERRIIKLYYEDNKSDQQIADIIGACRATINRRRNAAVEKIQHAIGQGHAM